MSDRNIRKSGFEETLRNKMDELASSVDCFDKISRKAFPEQNAGCSDSEYTVFELENITGKKRSFRFMPIIAAAAAIVLCLFFLPKNDGFMNFVYSNIGKSDKKAFRELICEISEETEKHEYVSFDCTLDEYIRKDILISPLYGCPFEQKDKDGINVRIYVKMCGEIPTNQVYAVEYEGDYEDGNFIAAADSKAKFTDEELESFKDGVSFGFSDKDNYRYALANYFNLENNGETGFFNDNGNAVSAAGFTYDLLFKYADSIYPVESDIVYFHETDDDDNNEYFYDIIAFYQDESGIRQCDDTVFDDSWSNVVYFNGSSARADEELSDFTDTGIFGAAAARAVDTDDILCVMPFDSSLSRVISYGEGGETIYVQEKGEDRYISAVSSPLNPQLYPDFRIYFVDSGVDSGEAVIRIASGSSAGLDYESKDLREADEARKQSEIAAEEERMMAEIEEQERILEQEQNHILEQMKSDEK